MIYEFLIDDILIKSFKRDLKDINQDIKITTSRKIDTKHKYIDYKIVTVNTNYIPLWDKKAVNDYLSLAKQNTGVVVY